MSEYSWPSENGRRPPTDGAAAWNATVRSLPVGTPVTGAVIGRQPFGAFLSVDGHPEAMGLARIDRMPRCLELPPVGRLVTGEVVWHAEHHHQVGIELREWAEHEDPLPGFAGRVGQVVAGTVTKIASIGCFVRIADCVEGLVPVGGAVADMADAVREGQDVSVRIVAVEVDAGRVHLSLEDICPAGS
ncbi:S1 RNA-binding domain-containing protein [Streptomyces stelliscabiei]|uniref:S1 RNA-binding domain-containing protein n=1 Tax=Streptomyces TaxID=1883 RepID=UPI000BCC9225|nr:S1 RNA-binding domain-containing protein [Streptomyces sp. 1222.2]SOD66402.1 S1 RNA binding domain-containing protein [Streptomyces sp. 1222.2]